MWQRHLRLFGFHVPLLFLSSILPNSALCKALLRWIKENCFFSHINRWPRSEDVEALLSDAQQTSFFCSLLLWPCCCCTADTVTLIRNHSEKKILCLTFCNDLKDNGIFCCVVVNLLETNKAKRPESRKKYKLSHLPFWLCGVTSFYVLERAILGKRRCQKAAFVQSECSSNWILFEQKLCESWFVITSKDTLRNRTGSLIFLEMVERPDLRNLSGL